MNKNQNLGQDLVEAVSEALNTQGSGKLVRPKFDVKALRKKLHLTQRQFAERYHIELETLRNWEQAKRNPDATGIALLTCIAKNPRVIQALLSHV